MKVDKRKQKRKGAWWAVTINPDPDVTAILVLCDSRKQARLEAHVRDGFVTRLAWRQE